MSVPVALDELARQLEVFGPRPFVMTTSEDRRGHVVSVAAQFDGARFAFSAGRTSRANVAATKAVTLLWPSTGGPYALIVDGTGEADDAAEVITVTPTRAVLHRLAGESEELPSCVRIEAAP